LNLISNRFYSYAVARGINGIMAFATVVFFTRLLGQEGYGEYALMMSFVGCFSAFFFQWIAVSCGRFLPGEKNPKIVYSSVKIMSSQSVVLVIFISFFLVFFGVSGFGEVAVIAVAGIAIGLFSISIQIENSAGRAANYAAATVLRSTLSLILGTAALLVYGNNALVIFVAASLVALALFAYFYQKEKWGIKLSGMEKKQRSLHVTEMRKYGVPIAFSIFCILIIDYSDRWLISYWYGTAGLGSYAAAYDLSQLMMGTAANLFSLVFFPAMVAAYSVSDRDRLQLLGQRNFDALVLLSVLAVAYASVMSEEIAALLFSKDMAKVAKDYFPWVVLAISVGSIKTYCFDLGYKLEKRSKNLLFIAFVMVLVNLAANISFIPLFGPVGGAYSTVLAMVVGSVMSYLGGGVKYFVLFDNARNAKLIGLVIAVILSSLMVEKAFSDSILGEISSLGVVACSAFAYIFLLDVCGIKTILRESGRW